MSVAELESRELQLESQGGLWSDAFRRLRRNPGAIVGFVLVAIFIFVAIFAPLLAPYDPRAQDLNLIINGCCPGPSAQHLLGVDDLGRDELSRIIYGARLSLLIGIVSVSVGLSLGIVLGSVSGFFGGWVDGVMMRFVDIMLAIPGFLMAIGIVALLGPGLISVMIAIGIVNVPIFARLLRGSVLAQRENDFVLAARSIGVRRKLDPAVARAPERDLAGDRRGHARARDGDHRRRRARLPRPRAAGPGDAGVGDDADRHRCATSRRRRSSPSSRASRSCSPCSAST